MNLVCFDNYFNQHCIIVFILVIFVDIRFVLYTARNWLVDFKKDSLKMSISLIKGYFRYKITFCYKVALDTQLMNFFI